MAVQSLLMAIQRLRMCIQRLQTEISSSTQKTFTMLPEQILKGGGKHQKTARHPSEDNKISVLKQ